MQIIIQHCHNIDSVVQVNGPLIKCHFKIGFGCVICRVSILSIDYQFNIITENDTQPLIMV